jgi:hypothetical protein
MYDSESSSEAGWIDWFCDLEGHEFFVNVSLSFPSAAVTLQTFGSIRPVYACLMAAERTNKGRRVMHFVD